MPRKQKPLLVIGHTNPDTDSICAAVCYARYKSDVLGEPALPRRAGNINPQTRFVLEHFQAESPALATDVRSRIEDIMVPREDLLVLRESDSIEKACDILPSRRFSFLPVVDGQDRCVGKLTALHLVEVLQRLAAAAHGGSPLGSADGELLHGTISAIVDREHVTFRADATVHDVLREISRSNEGGFIVQGAEARLQGVITRMSFITDARLRIAMVDHNETAQAVDGMEEADVVEIIDHHRIGARTSTLPITFINRVVGSTCTIVADLYRTAGITPPARDAGLMLSALLSDTLVLRSPTTTETDRQIARWLAEACGERIEPYGERMFAAGALLEGLDAHAIVARDRKTYTESGRRFGLAQVETVGFGPLLAMRAELAAELERVCEAEQCAFACLMITDVTRETSLLLFRGEKRVMSAITYPRREEGMFEMKDVLSRKKQVLPYFADLLRAL
jgi:inorganic pyrophosphatase/exopolyphosphatase